MDKLAYSYEEAAEVVGYSVTTLKTEVGRGNLAPSYANRKPVFRRAELDRWLESLPSEPPYL